MWFTRAEHVACAKQLNLCCSFNPSFTDWVQKVSRRGIFLNNSCWYRVKILQIYFVCSFYSHWHNMIIIRHIYCISRVLCFFQIQLDQIVHMLVKNVSNTCSAKTYYINRLTLKNRKSVATSSRAAELTDLRVQILQSHGGNSHRFRFDDNTTSNQRRSTDKLAPIRNEFESVISTFKMAYTTNEHTTIVIS
jgi:hypothetical protein